MAYAGTVRDMCSTVQLHTSGRYNKRREGYKVGTKHDLACTVLPCCRLVVREVNNLIITINVKFLSSQMKGKSNQNILLY